MFSWQQFWPTKAGIVYIQEKKDRLQARRRKYEDDGNTIRYDDDTGIRRSRQDYDTNIKRYDGRTTMIYWK